MLLSFVFLNSVERLIEELLLVVYESEPISPPALLMSAKRCASGDTECDEIVTPRDCAAMRSAVNTLAPSEEVGTSTTRWCSMARFPISELNLASSMANFSNPVLSACISVICSSTEVLVGGEAKDTSPEDF
jgi:hypothetical protein